MTGIMISPQLPLEEAFFLFFLCYQTMILINGVSSWRGHRRKRLEENLNNTSDVRDNA